MQQVSSAYRESMKESLRERGYILVTFHLVNQEAQSNASFENENWTYFASDTDVLDDGADESYTYATLEQDFTRVDGSMYFLPRESDGLTYYDTGITSKTLISDDTWTIGINLNIDAIDVKGLTINFGENYPTNFDIYTDSGQTLSVSDNDSAEWSTDEVFEEVTAFTIAIGAMLNEVSRARIYEIAFGYDLSFDNDVVTSSSLTSYVSPVCADVPQYDFTVSITNYDRIYDVDNPDSPFNFLEVGQLIEVKYGYDTPGSDDTEWVEGSVFECSTWESDDTKLSISGEDLLRNLTNTYYDGSYEPTGVTFYDLAVAIFEDAEIDDYYIDSRLKELTTTNPIPLVTHREALQMIANACRCILSQSRSGQIQIKSNFYPEGTATANGETEYSNVDNILDESTKAEYAVLDYEYIPVNGAMYFIPGDGDYSLNTGFVSEAVSDEDGYFDENPIVTISLEASRSYDGISLAFGYAWPANFTVRSYLDDELLTEVTVSSSDISQSIYVSSDFGECNLFEIEFTQTAESYNRVVLNHVSFSCASSFTMEKTDMSSYPLGTKLDVVKEVIVPATIYSTADEGCSIVSEEITCTGEGTFTYDSSSFYSNFEVYIDGTLMSSKILASDGTKTEYTLSETWTADDGTTYSAYAEVQQYSGFRITINYNLIGTFELTVTGTSYTTSQKNSTYTLRTRGDTVTWENSLVSSSEMADDLAEWLAEYYAQEIEYSYDTRGNPELDVNDIIYQENDYVDNMKVQITDTKLEFAQAFSGSIVCRRLEET